MKKMIESIKNWKPAVKFCVLCGLLVVVAAVAIILLITGMSGGEEPAVPTITPEGIVITYDRLDAEDIAFRSLDDLTTGVLKSAYTVQFTKNDVETQPEGEVEFSLPIPAGVDTAKMMVVVQDADGNVTYPDFDTDGDKVVFKASAYAVLGIVADEETQTEDSTTDPTAGGDSTGSVVTTTNSGNKTNASSTGKTTTTTGKVSGTTTTKVPVHSQLTKGVAEVVVIDGVPTLVVDGLRKTPMMMAQWLRPPAGNGFSRYPNYYQQTLDANINIYQVRVNGAARVNDFSTYFDKIIAQDPNAMFFVSIWVQSVSDYNFKNRADNVDTTKADAEVCSLGSLEWLDLATKRMNSIVTEFMNSKYAKHMLGFMPTAGNTGEWFDYSTYFNPQTFDSCKANQDHFRIWLKNKYGTDAALKKAWGNNSVTLSNATVPAYVYNGPFLDPVKQKNVIDYMEYHSYSLANAINTICAEVKKVTKDTKLVGVPYGYIAQLGQYANSTGSNAMTQVLACKDVDFLVSPLAYSHRKLIDYPGWHGFVDSCRNYGKLWFSEDDTPTYLNTRSDYSWYRHLSGYEQSSAALWKNMMSAVTKRFGFWWYDNYGQGMFANGNGDTRLLNDLSKMTATAHAAYGKANWKSRTEIAIVMDETSANYQTPGGTGNGVSFNEDMAIFKTRFAGLGAPVDVISTYDLVNGKGQDYKVYFFPQTYVVSDEVTAAINKLKSKGRTLVFLKTPGIMQADEARVSTPAEVTALTGFKLELASDSKNRKQGYGVGNVDRVASLTKQDYSKLLTDTFTLSKRPHMYADPNGGYTVLKKSDNNMPIVAKSVKSGWTSYFMDDITLLTTAELRTLCKDAGVFLYTNSDRAVVSADNLFVAVTVEGTGGNIEVDFPNNGTVYEITKDKEYQVKNNKVTVSNATAHTYVFYLGTEKDLGLED